MTPDPAAPDPALRTAAPLQFLAYMAQIGGADLHPLGARGTVWLLRALQLQPGLRVLEVGCGAGATLVEVAIRGRLAADGVDLLPAMLRVARRRVRLMGLTDRVHLYRADIRAPLPFATAQYDRVYTESVLGFQDAETVTALLREIGRVLKPGGLYIANEAIWKGSADPATVAAINAAADRDFGLRQAAADPWTLDHWTAALEAAGFTLIRADLLDPSATPPRLPRLDRGSRLRLALSRLLTRAYRSQPYWRPRLLRQRRHYRRLLQQHAADGQYIEARLFVLQKPWASSNAD